jgi:hypothetical protein
MELPVLRKDKITEIFLHTGISLVALANNLLSVRVIIGSGRFSR